MVLVMSWEQGKNDAVIAAAANDVTIPQESIRLRILADSDATEDQLLKRRIRDAIIEQMNAWVKGPQTIEEARETVRTHIPELETLVGRYVREAGYDYTYKVELGIVPFPTKVYGDKVYPAGDYEALRVTLGRGLGQNWWCVLFPPLCFVDVTAGESPNKDKDQPAKSGGEKVAANATAEATGSDEVEFRFFLFDWFKGFTHTVQSWFA